MARFLAFLLAAFICGPTCLCLAPGEAAVTAAQDKSCCRVSHASSHHEKSPAPTCGCTKCLAKRTFANAPVQPPDVSCTMASPLAFIWSHHLSLLPVPAPARRFAAGSGPPHEPRADLVSHCALLL